MAKNNKELKNNVEEVKKEKRLTKSELKGILMKAEFDVISNSKGKVFYICPRTNQELVLSKYGEGDSISFDMLSTMKQKSRGLLENYHIIIEDVYVADKEVNISVEDVYSYLGLAHVYNELEDFFEGTYLDDVLLKEAHEEFSRRIKRMDKKLLKKLIARSVELFEENRFNSHDKMLLFQEMTNNEFLYRKKK